MYVGICKLALVLGQSQSLKEKRMVIRRIKDRVRERLVDHTAPPFGGAAGRGHAPAIADRTGSGDKAVAGDDWVPAAWREESES